MELPLGGPALRHYTQSRPRPHRQKLNYRPSRPQEPIIESENEALELMGRVDEGVEEFFTKRVLPVETLKKQEEDEQLTITVQESAPASSAPCPPQSKTLRRKLGDFFTLRKRRGLKTETSHEGRKKASIADFIRPLREAARAEKDKDKDRVKKNDKENEREKEREEGGTAEPAQEEKPGSGPPALRGDAVPPRRALREGKSQSLILLSGSAGSGTANTRHAEKKHLEGQHSFEQKLHLMLQRIGVSKAQPGEPQNQEREMKKAESEGTIIDSKPEPPPTFTKPRTMSTSSDTRHQIRQSASAHESAGKPALLPKPIIKPGPQPVTSGRNTPENELAQIQEGETLPPTDPSQSAITSSPSSSALTTTATVTKPTLEPIPDSNDVAYPSKNPPLPDSDVCIDSVQPPTTTATSDATDSSADQLSPTTITVSTAAIETATSVSTYSISSESIAPKPSIASDSTTLTTPSITTSVPVAIKESSASVASADPSSNTPLPVFNGATTDYTPATSSTDTSSVTTIVDTTSSVPTSILDDPALCSATTSSVTISSRSDSTSAPVASTTSEILASPATKISTPTHDSINMASPSTAILSADSTTGPCAGFDAGPCCASAAPTQRDAASPPADVVISASPSDQTNPVTLVTTGITDTSFTNSPMPASTNATNHTTTTSSDTNSEIPASVHSSATDDQDWTTNNVISTVPASSTVTTAAKSGAGAPPDSTRPTPSHSESPAQHNNLQTSPGDAESSQESSVKDESDTCVQRGNPNKSDESSQEVNTRNDNETEQEKALLEENGRTNDDTMRKESGLEKAELDDGKGRVDGEQKEETDKK